MKPVLKSLLFSLLTVLITACVQLEQREESSGQVQLAGGQLNSLTDLSIDALRARDYGGGKINVVSTLDRKCTSREETGERPRRATRMLAAYPSEGLSVYARIDVPFEAPPEAGYPVMIFAHGWVGAENAPNWHFACTTESNYGDVYGDVVNAWAEAGYVVLVPGYRGHGTVNGVPAEGHDDILAWDNSAYLMPSFYAVDVMNLLAVSLSETGIDVLDEAGAPRNIKLDPSRVVMNGHSQGGDVTLTVLAAVGEGAPSGLSLAGASIWAGNIADRFTQVATFEAMSTSPEAFLAGDGTWNGTAIGVDGSENPNFVFGFPADWTGSPYPEEWSWQNETYYRSSVAEALSAKADDMYNIIHSQVADLEGLVWRLQTGENGRASIEHDVRLAALMSRIGGFDVPEFLSEPLNLHYSDRDYYSLPAWNEQLCTQANAVGGRCQTFEYFGNTHSLGLSEHSWFSPPGSIAGHSQFIKRDLCSFRPDTAPPEQGDDCQAGNLD